METATIENPKTNNLETTDRVFSAISGALLLFNALRKEDKSILKIAAGGYMLYRGITGDCPISSKLGVNSAILSNVTRLF